MTDPVDNVEDCVLYRIVVSQFTVSSVGEGWKVGAGVRGRRRRAEGRTRIWEYVWE